MQRSGLAPDIPAGWGSIIPADIPDIPADEEPVKDKYYYG